TPSTSPGLRRAGPGSHGTPRPASSLRRASPPTVRAPGGRRPSAVLLMAACVTQRRRGPAEGGRAEVGQPLRQQGPAEGRGVYSSARAGSCPSPSSPWVMLEGAVRSVSAGRGRDFDLDRPEQAIEAEGPVVTPFVDEERRSAVHATANAS